MKDNFSTHSYKSRMSQDRKRHYDHNSISTVLTWRTRPLFDPFPLMANTQEPTNSVIIVLQSGQKYNIICKRKEKGCIIIF